MPAGLLLTHFRPHQAKSTEKSKTSSIFQVFFFHEGTVISQVFRILVHILIQIRVDI